MRRYLLDTGTMGDFINHRKQVDTKVRAARVAGNRIGTCMPVVAELHFGVEYSQTRSQNLKKLQRALSGLLVWPFTWDSALEYGRIAADLKRRGVVIQQIDIQVAAIAITLGDCVVVSGDSDFLSIPGLSVENWAI